MSLLNIKCFWVSMHLTLKLLLFVICIAITNSTFSTQRKHFQSKCATVAPNIHHTCVVITIIRFIINESVSDDYDGITWHPTVFHKYYKTVLVGRVRARILPYWGYSRYKDKRELIFTENSRNIDFATHSSFDVHTT